jgi:hypothetical protein
MFSCERKGGFSCENNTATKNGQSGTSVVRGKRWGVTVVLENEPRGVGGGLIRIDLAAHDREQSKL